MSHDALGTRMKSYEDMINNQRCMPLLPILARMDGRAFHSFTRDLNRPYDECFARIMTETTLYLAQETNANMGYTQSDEITLTWLSNDIKSQVWFDGRIAKMTSQLAAHATMMFNRLTAQYLSQEYVDRLPTFDARVWQVPNTSEAANVFIWREQDAVRNSISAAAQMHYSDKELFGKNSDEKQEMLWKKGINWHDYPVFFKRGVYVQRKKVLKPFTTDEIERLPLKHEARSNPGLMVERSEWRVMELPILTTVTNREKVIFDGAEPVEASSLTNESISLRVWQSQMMDDSLKRIFSKPEENR